MQKINHKADKEDKDDGNNRGALRLSEGITLNT